LVFAHWFAQPDTAERGRARLKEAASLSEQSVPSQSDSLAVLYCLAGPRANSTWRGEEMKKILMVATVAIAVLMLQTNSFALDATRSVQTVHRADGTEPMPPHSRLDGTEPMPPHSR
jgi:hypothetical protein